jgi:hypothetical protein
VRCTPGGTRSTPWPYRDRLRPILREERGPVLAGEIGFTAAGSAAFKHGIRDSIHGRSTRTDGSVAQLGCSRRERAAAEDEAARFFFPHGSGRRRQAASVRRKSGCASRLPPRGGDEPWLAEFTRQLGTLCRRGCAVAGAAGAGAPGAQSVLPLRDWRVARRSLPARAGAGEWRAPPCFPPRCMWPLVAPARRAAGSCGAVAAGEVSREGGPPPAGGKGALNYPAAVLR